MAMINAAAWNGQDQNMSPAGDDDFQQYFDIGMSNNESMPFDFQPFNAQNGPAMVQHDHREPVDTPMSDAGVSSIVAPNKMGVHNQVPAMTSAPSHPTVLSHILPHQQTPNDAISEIDAQINFLQHQKLQQQQRQLEEQQRRLQEQQAALYAQRQQHQQQQQQQQQQQRNIVPPTPQSLEIQAAGRYYASQDQAHSSRMFDSYQPMKEQQDAIFTPLVSPAVTPLDAHFPIDNQFMVHGNYFSPITSPALYAQQDPTLFYDPRHSAHTSHTTNSPAAMDVESPSSTTPADNLPPKETRKSNPPRRKPKVRQSPITKPQKRKGASTPVMNAQALSELAEAVAVAEGSEPAPKPKSVSVSSNEESDNASVSPEALEMPPPPLPLVRSARQSPYIAPQSSDKSVPVPVSLPKCQNGKPSPATPASLFRISPRNQTADQSQATSNAPEHIESFELPESVNSIKPSQPRVSLSKTQQSPRVSPDGDTPKMTALQSLPSPLVPKPIQPASASQSPQLNPRPSTSSLKKTPLMAPKGGRKRASMSSVSPALLPRISPNIKPLLPGTPGANEDSASRLLASKSNYQRILEGNTVPGVTYPSELSTNLTSKRTSHKIAEQGRRNRINSALQEIATLLPKGVLKESSEGDSENVNGDKADAKQSNAPNSKASTVESAIEYIKHLQKELAEANKRAEEAEKKLRETAQLAS
ncbi:helix-loop-helix DNA-binding domain-containing protein [Nemania sp. FL0916]|nr:helix-loop-helix DNA-binding domain-containing protein [Nemania sp. FL0916]